MIRTKCSIGDKVDDVLTDAHIIRIKVFVNEQKVPEELEMDNKDKEAYHIVIYYEERAVATGRLLLENNEYIIGRIAVIKKERKNGYGDLVVRILIRKAFDLGANRVIVHAQIRAMEFYEKIGFVVSGEEYIEDGTGIPHIDMVKNEDVSGNC